MDRLGRFRSMFIPKGDAWKYSLGLARQMNGNVHKPNPTPHQSPQDKTDMEEYT